MNWIKRSVINPYGVVIVCLGQTQSGRHLYVATDGARRLEFAVSEENERSFSSSMEAINELSELVWFTLNVSYPYYPSRQWAIKETEVQQLEMSLQEIAYKLCLLLSIPRSEWIIFRPKKKFTNHYTSKKFL